MKLTAMLAWWNEDGPDLACLIPSLAGLADHVLAVDGGIDGTPGATPASPPGQARLIRKLCAHYGIACTVFTPDKVWAGEVEKRAAMTAMLPEGTDWTFCADADWVFAGDKAALRRQLVATQADVVTVRYVMPSPIDDNTWKITRQQWYTEMADAPTDYRAFMRVLPGFTVESHHWWFSAVRDGTRIAYYEGEGVTPATVEAAACEFLIEHRCLFRPRQARLDRDAFYDHRDAVVAVTGVEL